ncbi:MAG: hypothetical protein OEY94_08650 [Alphaproteobacteria bacterium]|nr:hypothetical protein [Alphaproteobacteria bacterium]
MSVYSYDPGHRYRKRAAKRMMSMIMFILVFFTIFAAGYWFGGLASQRDIIVLKQEKDAAEKQYMQTQSEMTKMRSDVQTANMRLEQMQKNYKEVLGDGTMQELVEMVKRQLDEGIDSDRLRSVILSARPPQNCSKPESRRFIISTPVYNGPESNVTVKSGDITISGSGESVINSKDQSEAWYDPGKKVLIKFATNDGREEIKEGVLPLHHSVVIGSKEYRFTIAKGAQSFVKVTYDNCDYP